jgi:general secretion pathway protein B
VSLILDALNRSRQDSDPVPGLATHHPMEQVPSGKRQLLPWVALVVALVLIAWLLLERGNDSPAVSPRGDADAPVVELSGNTGNAAPEVQAQLDSRVETGRIGHAVDSAVQLSKAKAQARQRRVEDATVQAPPQPLAKPSAPAAKAVESDAVEKLYRQRETAAPATATPQTPAARSLQPARQEQAQTSVNEAAEARRDEQPVDIERMLGEARDEIENTGLVEHPAPFVASLSQNTKNGIPTVMYQRHDYTNKAGRSSVVLNGKTLKVGGSAAPGVKVDEILPDSVVLSHNGTQFRLRALNSWVNL